MTALVVRSGSIPPKYTSGLYNARGSHACIAGPRRLGENARMSLPNPKESKEEISKRLKLTREAMGLSQADFCKLTEIATNTWNNYERCVSRISLEEAMKVTRATGVGLDWIYRGEEAMLPGRILEGIRRLRAEAETTARKSA